jgi:predicted transcriptional regulator
MPESTRERRRMQRMLTAKSFAEVEASIADIDWRLLLWLLHYPLQRTDDLVVGVSRWASRATVYRHVRLLLESGLFESVLPKTSV